MKQLKKGDVVILHVVRVLDDGMGTQTYGDLGIISEWLDHNSPVDGSGGYKVMVSENTYRACTRDELEVIDNIELEQSWTDATAIRHSAPAPIKETNFKVGDRVKTRNVKGNITAIEKGDLYGGYASVKFDGIEREHRCRLETLEKVLFFDEVNGCLHRTGKFETVKVHDDEIQATINDKQVRLITKDNKVTIVCTNCNHVMHEITNI